jgi:transcriptional regulator GlxA family with amidase domain
LLWRGFVTAGAALSHYLSHSDQLVEKFEAWARQSSTTFSRHHAARAVGTSGRTLERRLRHALGKSPLSAARLSEALHLDVKR